MRNLQPYSHYCFSKISRTLFHFLNNTYWVSLFLRNNSLIFQTGFSCFSVTLFYSTLFCCGRKANLVRFTLFYSILLTLTHRWNDRQRVTYTRFAWAGGTCPLFVWAGGTFFPVVLLCCVSFWFWREMRELTLHYFPADCFGIKREIVFGDMYILSVQYSCAVMSVFLLWRESQFCSNTLQSRSFLKNIENFLCKKNNPI